MLMKILLEIQIMNPMINRKQSVNFTKRKIVNMGDQEKTALINTLHPAKSLKCLVMKKRGVMTQIVKNYTEKCANIL